MSEWCICGSDPSVLYGNGDDDDDDVGLDWFGETHLMVIFQ